MHADILGGTDVQGKRRRKRIVFWRPVAVTIILLVLLLVTMFVMFAELVRGMVNRDLKPLKHCECSFFVVE